jgi:hypothetical protein
MKSTKTGPSTTRSETMTTTATATQTTRQPLTARQVQSIRDVIAARDTALADLRIAPAHQQGSEWARDRMGDVKYANHFIARSAQRWGYMPAELIEACNGVDEG